MVEDATGLVGNIPASPYSKGETKKRFDNFWLIYEYIIYIILLIIIIIIIIITIIIIWIYIALIKD